ncbi:hypothetical protein FB451DRAFT_1469579 [Mycena latifolia]|nr:hypothetical protein FB451DRAFT_1469579 [Mycena latifolia]
MSDSNSYNAGGQQWGQYPQPRIHLDQEYFADSYQSNADTFDAAQFTPLPPSQPGSLHPSRSNSRSSSLTRSPYNPSAPLDPSQAHAVYTSPPSQNFSSFAQYAAFLNYADQPEYSPATYNFAPQAPPLAVLGSNAAIRPPPNPFPPSGPSRSTSIASGPSRSASQPQPKVKRRRVAKPNEAGDDDMDEGGDVEEERRRAKLSAGGACARCKTLKVKCEFDTEIDACKKCLNSGNECVVPGRKKRVSPPKREFLLNQIREQAAQIQKLMSQLEGQSQLANSSTADALPPTSLHSPVHSSPSVNTSDYGTDPDSSAKAVADWIAKARGSLAEFDGFIGMGGAGILKSYLVKEDAEDSSSSEFEDVADSDDSEYNIEVIDTRGEEVSHRGRSRDHSIAARGRDTAGAKLATLPNEASAFGLMANLSLKTRAENPEAKDGAAALGVANADFFRSNPIPDPGRSRPLGGGPPAPHIFSSGLIAPQEAEKLFDIYFQTMNISVSALDPVLHTPQKTFFRSPFLFTVVCALASRFYTERPEIYPRAMRLAQMVAGNALTTGQKSVDLCQGYLLMAAYPVPARRWDEDRGWIYLGLAIRMATDLNLHLPSTATPLNEIHAREMLNRTRTWLHCFNLDRSMGSEYGKAPTIRNTDYIATHAEDWWRSSPYNIVHSDIHISGYNADLKVMGAFMAKIYSDPTTPTGLNKNVDFEAIATETDEELKQLAEKWRLVLDQTDRTHPHNRYRCGMLKLAFSYGRLVALSFGFQHAFAKNNTGENPFFERCLAAASDVVSATVQDLGGGPAQRVYLRHGPIGVSIFVTFAASMLVKFLQPKFASYLTGDKRKEVRGLVKSVINLLASPEVSVDDKHGPRLYARFLEGLLAAPLAKRQRRPAAVRSDSNSNANQAMATDGGDSTPSSAASPASAHSLSPAPTTAALSFDSFAPPLGGSVDPFMPLAVPAADPSVPNYPVFPPTMSYNDAVQGMQARPDGALRDFRSPKSHYCSPGI